jgi:hypothetical protein
MSSKPNAPNASAKLRLAIASFRACVGATSVMGTSPPATPSYPTICGCSGSPAGTPFGTPFSATGRPLEAITQEACTFHDRWAFFDDEEVQIVNRNGGVRIADALGDKQVGILRSHDLVNYRSLELAFAFLVSRYIGDPSVVD